MADALADLGDWYMVFDKPRRARGLYEDAYRILANSPDYAHLADEFMKDPKPMHFISTPEPGFLDGAPPNLQELKLEVTMTVTSRGDVRTVEILNPPEDMSEDDQWQIKKQLQETPFRPAMQEGEVVSTKEFLWNYVIVKYGEAS